MLLVITGITSRHWWIKLNFASILSVLWDWWYIILKLHNQHWPKVHLGTILRSSHDRCCIKQGVLKNFVKITGKHLCQSLLFNNVPGLRPATLLKTRLWHRCFQFCRIFRSTFLTEQVWVSSYCSCMMELFCFFFKRLKGYNYFAKRLHQRY